MTPFSFKKHNATRMARSAKVMKRLLGTRSTKSPQPETREKSKVMREFPKRPAPLLPTKPAEKVKNKRKTNNQRKPPLPLVQDFLGKLFLSTGSPNRIGSNETASPTLKH